MSQQSQNLATTSQELEEERVFSLSNKPVLSEEKESVNSLSDDELSKKNAVVTNAPNTNELLESYESWKTEFEEALIHIQSIAAADREQILENARLRIVELQQEDDTLDIDMLTDAFELLRTQLTRNDNSEGDAVDDDNAEFVMGESDTVATVDKLDDDSNMDSYEEKSLEEYYPGSVEDLEKEIQEAFEHVRRIGNYHGRELADRLSETFYETNGREPDAKELYGIFYRLQQSLMDEAADELLDDIDENNTAAARDDVDIDGDNELTDAGNTDIDVNNECAVNQPVIDENESDDSDYKPTPEDEQTEAAREAELLAEYERDQLEGTTGANDELVTAEVEMAVNLDEIELPQSIDRSVFIAACDRLKQMTDHNVTRAEIDRIINHLLQIILEENDSILTAINDHVDEDTDSDYVPNEDEEAQSSDIDDAVQNEDDFEVRIDS